MVSLLFSVFFLFALVPGLQAQNVDDKIKALEQELAKLKTDQITLKKQATAAEAALPSFSYRPGAGVSITAPDQSWQLKFGYEFAYDMMFLEGNDARREGDFGLFGRRNRPAVNYCWDRCFYEFVAELDFDGDETGTRETTNQRSAMFIHFEQMNPFFPTLQFGMDAPGAGSRYRSSELTFELPTLDRNNGFNTGSHTGIGFRWEELPVGQQFHYYWVIHGMGRGDGLKDQSNKQDHVVYYNISPFGDTKDKWLSGLGFSAMAWFGNIDDRNATNSTTSFQLRTQEGSTRLVLFQTPTHGRGDPHTFLQPSLQWRVGPYQFRTVAGFDRYHSDTTAAVPVNSRGTYWKFMNDLMLWSPKGFLTGSATTPNTLGVGFSWERTWVDCGFVGCNAAAGSGGIRRNTLVIREVGLRYWFRPSLSLHLALKQHDLNNTPLPAQIATGCSKNTAANPSKDCDWLDAVLRFYWIF
jgi:hypothetical protein